MTSSPKNDRIDKESTVKSNVITKEQESREKEDTETLSKDTIETNTSDSTSKLVLSTCDTTKEADASRYKTPNVTPQ